MNLTRQSAFTLLELSIVLVIIGLLAGGILVGNELIKNATLKKIIRQAESYKTAIFTFKNKYRCLPGDCSHATDFWPERDSLDCIPQVGIVYLTSTGEETCNGDGNDKLDLIVTPPTAEPYCFWQQLANAKLIPGTFDCSINTLPGAGTQSGTVTQGARLLMGYNIEQDPNSFFYYMSGHVLVFLSVTGTAGAYNMQNPALSPADAYGLDSKVDDGKPFTGVMMQASVRQHPILETRLSGCVDEPTSPASDYENPAANYIVTSSDIKCLLGLRMGF
jgi:prepilin-type N-terminal cleavage/methylation domain-containing protein